MTTQPNMRVYSCIFALLGVLGLSGCLDTEAPAGNPDHKAGDKSENADDRTNSDGCSVPAICHLCEDGSCAEPKVEMVNGECGAVTFVCADGNGSGQSIEPNAPEGGCEVPAICHLCEDGTCASPIIDSTNGNCANVSFSCSARGLGGDGNVGTVVDLPCPVPLLCEICEDGSCAEPHVEMIDGQCGGVSYTCPEDSPTP